MSRKLFFVLCFSLISCQTLYYPTQDFTKKSYKPLKKGTLELTVRSKLVSAFSDPIHLFDYDTAYRKGEREIKSSMQSFCGGAYQILSAIKKKEKIRMETHSSTSTHYHSNTHHSDFSQNIVAGPKPKIHNYYKGRKRIYNRKGRRRAYKRPTQNLLLGTQNSTGHEWQSGSAHGGSSTITQPVYRRYTEFHFQCQ